MSRHDERLCDEGRCLCYWAPNEHRIPDVLDNAGKACQEWIRAWRESVGPVEPRPPIRFAAVLGREALAMQREGASLPDMLRVFSAAARDGATPNGVSA